MWKFGLLWALLISVTAAQHVIVEIVSIIDHSSVAACLLKIHSIIQSSSDKTRLSFKFLLMPSSELSLREWDESFSKCFPQVRFETKLWTRPSKLIQLSGASFEKEVIFARFYLADVFSDVKKFIYLDNDIVVTADMLDLYNQRLIQVDVIPSGDDTTHSISVPNPRHASKDFQHPHHAAKVVGPAATVGFVYETHPVYREYLRSHFNLSHPVVKKAIESSGNDAFLNGGVFVVDAVRWRQKKYTTLVEDFMLRNAAEHMYDAAAAGDQGPFLLLFQNDTAYLAPKYNMRRLPKKTINLLNDVQITGTVDLQSFPVVNLRLFLTKIMTVSLFL